MADHVTIQFTLSPDQASGFAEVLKRLQRRNIGLSDLNLANRHQPDEQHQAEQAIDELQKALANAGFAAR